MAATDQLCLQLYLQLCALQNCQPTAAVRASTTEGTARVRETVRERTVCACPMRVTVRRFRVGASVVVVPSECELGVWGGVCWAFAWAGSHRVGRGEHTFGGARHTTCLCASMRWSVRAQA